MAGITGLVGLPGTGKSYTAVEFFVLPSLKQGRQIITNLPLKMDVVLNDFPNAKVTFIEDINSTDWNNIGNGAILLLDEIWQIWPAGMQAKAIPKEQLALIKEHRHRSDANGKSMDIVLIAQDLADIAATIRGMIEVTIINTKHLDLGMEGAFIRHFYRGAIRGQTGPRGALLKSENGKYKPEVYKYYKTHMHGDSQNVDERRVIKTSIFSSFMFKAAIFVILLTLIIGGFALSKTKENIAKATTKRQPAKPVVTQPVNQTSQPINAEKSVKKQALSAPAPDKPNYSQSWKLIGSYQFIHRGGSVPVYIVKSTTGAERKIHANLCKDDGLEVICTLDGEVVARFTGFGGGFDLQRNSNHFHN